MKVQNRRVLYSNKKKNLKIPFNSRMKGKFSEKLISIWMECVSTFFPSSITSVATLPLLAHTYGRGRLANVLIYNIVMRFHSTNVSVLIFFIYFFFPFILFTFLMFPIPIYLLLLAISIVCIIIGMMWWNWKRGFFFVIHFIVIIIIIRYM